MSVEVLPEAMAPANSEIIGDPSQNGDGQQIREKQHALGGYPAIMLPFPSTFASDPTNPTIFLAPLRDNRSNYSAVSKTCLLLNQFAANGSSKATTTANANASIGSMAYVDSSSLFHESSFAQTISESFAALLECIREHHDRRCRVISCKTIATVARAAYARLRKSPHTTTGLRDDTTANVNINSNGNNITSNTAGSNYMNRLDDEVGNDVPMALCTAALDDADDGVAATAMSGLGTIILSTTPTLGTLNDDELWTEARAIAQIGLQPYAPTIRQLLDEDSTALQSELQVRIFENVICPRLMQLVSRCLVLNHPTHLSMILPILTASLVYRSKTTLPMTKSLGDSDGGKPNILKRRTHEQLDCHSLMSTVVDEILLPLMQESTVATMGASLTAALSSIRLIHACPTATWVKEISHWAITVLKDECRNECMCVETRLQILSTLMILSRAVPLAERVNAVLEFVVDRVMELPSTTKAPLGVVSAGLLLELDNLHSIDTNVGMDQYRTPSRPAFWAEIALSFFMDGPLELNGGNKTDSKVRSKTLAKFLECSTIADILEERNDDDSTIGTHSKIREELVTAFCMVAFQVGRRYKTGSKSSRASSLTARQDEIDEWVRLSLTVLNAFIACTEWGAAPLYIEEEITMLTASQAAYTRLLQEVLHTAGLLDTNSITLKMTSITCPPHLLWGQMEEDSEYLLRFETMPLIKNMVEPLGELIDNLVKREMKAAGIASHHMRISLMSLAADQWIQARNAASKGSSSSSSEIGMNIDSAKQLLVTVSPRRMLGKVVDSNKNQIEDYSNKMKDKYKKAAQDTVSVCIACIESMALMACYYTKKFGNTNDTRAVLNYSIKALQGKAGNDSDSHVLPLCEAAIERIQSAFASSGETATNSISLSPLVPVEFVRRSIISNVSISQGPDAFNEGYITQLSRLIITSRADRCIYSFPLIHNLPSKVRKQNWLRLSPSPLPQSRSPHNALAHIPKFKWGSNVAVCTAGSDPVAVTLAYYLRRSMRYDGEDEFRLMITMRVDNLTAVEIPNGLRVELGFTEENIATSANAQDADSLEVSNAFGEGYEKSVGKSAFGSSVATFKQELKGGDHISWDIMMNPLPMTGSLSLNPSIVFRSLDKETPYAAWVSTELQQKDGEETSVTSSNSKAVSVGTDNNDGKVQKQNVSIACEPMQLSPMIGLQPCPFVFFRDSQGDVESFRFLWSRMPCRLTAFKLVADPNPGEAPARLYDAMRLATISKVKFRGDPRTGEAITHLWAFVNPRGKRALFALGKQDQGKILHVRGDDKQLLLCLLGTSTSRRSVISSLTPGLKPLHRDIFK